MISNAEPTSSTASSRDIVYVPRLVEIVGKEKLTEQDTYYLLRFLDGAELTHDPGQFVQVSVFGVGEAPISVSSSPTRHGSFDICVRSVGDVTEAMRRLSVGDVLGIRGPYGRGFSVDSMRGHDLLFVAGGLGIVPMRALIQNVLDERQDFGRVTILYGARTPRDILFRDEVASWGDRGDVDLRLTVDGGDESWNGDVGVVTKALRTLKLSPRHTVSIVVGPPVMFKFVVWELLNKGCYENNIFLSLERRMKCGVGKCGHCQLNSVYVCREGPVFTYTELKKLEEAKI